MSMYYSRLSKIIVAAALSSLINQVFATESISLAAESEITTNTRLINNFQARVWQDIIPVSTINPQPSKLQEFTKKILHRDLGPLSLNLNLRSPVKLSANTLTFNIDLVKSADLLRATL